MGRPLTTYDHIAIAEDVIYPVFLIGAIILSIRHGFTRSSGWRFLIIFSLARIIGASMLLASINDYTNINLYIGWVVCESLGLGPLVLVNLGLLTRVFESINRQGHVVVRPIYNHVMQLLMVVAVILTIVGGTQATYHVGDSFSGGFPKVDYPTLSKVGVILMIVVIVLLAVTVAIAFANQGYVAQGEHRIIVATAACLPFLVVRVAYSGLKVLGGQQSTPYVFLGMSTIMEIIVTLIDECVGLTLDKVPEPIVDEEMTRQGKRQHRR